MSERHTDEHMPEPGPFQLALNTLGMALDGLKARPEGIPSPQVDVQRLRRQVADLDERFGQNAEAINDRLCRLEAGQPFDDGLPADDRFAALIADQEKDRAEMRERLDALRNEVHCFSGLVVAPSTDQEERLNAVAAVQGRLTDRIYALEQKPTVGADYTFVPTRDEFATLAAQMAALSGEVAELRQMLEQAGRQDRSWKDSINHVLGRRPPRG